MVTNTYLHAILPADTVRFRLSLGATVTRSPSSPSSLQDYIRDLDKLGMQDAVLSDILTTPQHLVVPHDVARWRTGDTLGYDVTTMSNRLYYTRRGLYFYVDKYGPKNGLSKFIQLRGAGGLTLMDLIRGDAFESASQRIQRLADPRSKP